MIDVRSKMIQAFREANGGLFSSVEKADVGNSYQELEKQGVALMGWADPFMPDFPYQNILNRRQWMQSIWLQLLITQRQ